MSILFSKHIPKVTYSNYFHSYYYCSSQPSFPMYYFDSEVTGFLAFINGRLQCFLHSSQNDFVTLLHKTFHWLPVLHIGAKPGSQQWLTNSHFSFFTTLPLVQYALTSSWDTLSQGFCACSLCLECSSCRNPNDSYFQVFLNFKKILCFWEIFI